MVNKMVDEFYLEKFMVIQQQNIVLYRLLLSIYENPETRHLVEQQLGNNVFDILKDCPA
jgi:hypothetical protein